jgi:uncharacterized protein (TIGR02147 family)
MHNLHSSFDPPLDHWSQPWTKARGSASPIIEGMEPMNLFEFDDFRVYLNHVRDHYPGLRRPITLERWCKKLSYKSPRSVAMVLKGQRLPSEELVLAFSVDLNHSESERRYFELLVRKERYRGNVPKSVLDELQKLNPKLIHRKALDADVFSYMSSWHHYVIFYLADGPGFRSDVNWIVERLGGRITAEDAAASLELLTKLGLLEKTGEGKYGVSSKDPLINMEDIPSAAGRRHMVEQMEQAKQALLFQPMMDREVTSMTLRVNRKRLPEVKKMIREFRDKFDKEFFDETSSDVSQLNIQFFFHTVEGK